MSKTARLSFSVTPEIRDNCLCLHVQRAARALARRYDEMLRPAGLTSGQFSLMMALNRPKAPTIGEVAGVLAMDRTTVTANLKPLARRGLVVVTADPADRRSRRMRLTPQGRRTLAAALPHWRKAQEETARLVGEDFPKRLIAALHKLS